MDANTTNEFIGGLSGPLRALHGSAVILACVLGIAGNVLVVISIANTPKLRTSHNAFVLNLSVTDLLLSVLSMPFYVASILTEGGALTPSVCRFKVKVSLIFWQVCMFTLAALATNRYLLVAKSAKTYKRFCGCKQIAFFLCFVWLQGLAISLFSEFAIEVEIRYILAFSSCAVDPWHPASHRYIAALIGILVLTVMLIIPVQYFRVLMTVRASRRRVQRAVGMEISTVNQQQAEDPPNLPCPTGIPKEEIKLLKMFVLLYLVNAVSYVPISIVYLFVTTIPEVIRGARFGIFVLAIAPAVNPVVYAWMNRGIRRACYRFLTCKRVTSSRLVRRLEQAQSRIVASLK